MILPFASPILNRPIPDFTSQSLVVDLVSAIDPSFPLKEDSSPFVLSTLPSELENQLLLEETASIEISKPSTKKSILSPKGPRSRTLLETSEDNQLDPSMTQFSSESISSRLEDSFLVNSETSSVRLSNSEPKRARKSDEIFFAELDRLDKEEAEARTNLSNKKRCLSASNGVSDSNLEDVLNSTTVFTTSTRVRKVKKSKKPSLADTVIASFTPEEQRFFLDREPVISDWVYLSQDETTKMINIPLPEKIQSMSKVIYIFQKIRRLDEENIEILGAQIGKTGDLMGSRINGYMKVLNSKDKASSFIQDLRTNPKSYRFGILHELSIEQVLDRFEIGFIHFKKQKYPIFNKNKGGGGGSARREERSSSYYIPNLGELTPQRRYQAKIEKGTIRFQYSPGLHKLLKKIEGEKKPWQSTIYSILQHSTGQRYIGTSGNAARRGTQHCYSAEYALPESHKYDPSVKLSGIIHKAIAENPSDFSFGVLPIYYEDPVHLSPSSRSKVIKKLTIGDAEKLIIQAVGTLAPLGFNLHLGGNGSIKRQFSPLTIPEPGSLGTA